MYVALMCVYRLANKEIGLFYMTLKVFITVYQLNIKPE